MKPTDPTEPLEDLFEKEKTNVKVQSLDSSGWQIIYEELWHKMNNQIESSTRSVLIGDEYRYGCPLLSSKDGKLQALPGVLF